MLITAGRCSGDHCKSEKEIDEYIDKFPYIGFNFNNQIYRPNVYYDDHQEVIEKVASLKLNKLDGYLTRFEIERAELESEETYDGFGLNPYRA